MRHSKFIKIASIALLSLGLSSCFVTGQEEASIALAKWQGKPINDFFFKYGKGEFQAKNSQGLKAYAWASPKRVVENVGDTVLVKVESQFFPGTFTKKFVTLPSTFTTSQCVLRIETTSSGRILSSQNVNNSGECAKYFSLSKAEIEALLEARK